MPESTLIERAVLPIPQPRKQTLLVVDDEEGPRQSIRIVFKEEYNVLTADNGAAAIQLAKENAVDVAVLDIRMAGLSGIDVLNALKAIDFRIEAVVLTAYETLETACQALRLGACDYLNKPFDIATLRQAVRMAMDRRALSLRIRASNQRLRELQQELQDQKIQEELVRTRGEIYASIIHDMNGPLTVISGFAEVINQRIGDATHLEGEKLDIIKDRLTLITRQVANCIQISNRYLSFLRGCSGESTPVSVNQILDDLGELLRTHRDAHRNTFVIRRLVEDDCAQINGTDLIQILLNLAINALQCSDQPHQVEIRAEQLAEPLDVSRFSNGPESFFVNREGFSNTGPVLALSVTDNGPGISPEVIANVFEPYFTTKPAGQGTGLGLCIVKYLVEQAGGAVHLSTQLGQGTAFTVYLPGQPSGSPPERP